MTAESSDSKKALKPFVLPAFSVPWLGAGFFSRHGGLSEGVFASLNAAYGKEAKEVVDGNRALIVKHVLGAEGHLCVPSHAHSPGVITVEQKTLEFFHYGAKRPDSDALVTKLPGMVLAVLGADCAPVMFVDPTARVIGIAHCGWKGTRTGVIQATVKAMVELGASASNITAGVGPCLHSQSYEVDLDFPEKFEKEDALCFSKSPSQQKMQFDLPLLIRSRLLAAGIDKARVQELGHDTLSREELWYSNRRATLRGEKAYGNHMSAIVIKPETEKQKEKEKTEAAAAAGGATA